MPQSKQCSMSSFKHGVFRWAKRANPDAALHGEHGGNRRPTLRKILDYAKLRNRSKKEDDAMQRYSKGIDFVGELPVDIVISKLIPMFMDHYIDSWGPCEYLYVSKRWRDRIVQCFQGLHFWVPDEEERTQRCLQLVQFPQYAKALRVEWYGRWWMDDLLRELNLCSLRELVVNGPDDTMDRFLPTLRSFSRNLRHLTIDHLHVSLYDLLLACPKLTSLTLSVYYHVTFDYIGLTTWPTLTALSISHVSGPITCDEVTLICKSFPALQKLELRSCADIQCVLVVSESFPSLTYLYICVYSNAVRIKFLDQGRQQHAQGITHLDICGSTQPNITCKDIFSLLKKHHTTLERLNWGMRLDKDDYDVFSLVYPRLTKLLLGCSGWWMLRNAPLLEELYITCDTIKEHPAVLGRIPANLQKLRMDITSYSPFPYMTSITRYFRRYHARAYSLSQLIIYTRKMKDVEMMLESICHLNQLDRLMIQYLNWDVTQMEIFIDQLANGCRRLSCLKLFSRTMPSPHAVNALKQLEHLNHFAFKIEEKDPTGGKFWDAIETLTQIKCIEIYCIKTFQLSEMRRVKGKRPDMEMIINRDAVPF
ncbi:hypothetical protein O0I10_006701 [Lichtheimia ornata]|uniref:F-box domain-containing protein n=1 Tax=Lichtheimia ornata TaxID=688661 RepID=A0AAD7XX13_9FUNG|nr:uncharacterized protein O0I10_006701 [Lichtheimia ornata]KAJ8657635.1 hypothetical protein O0I10_006701 [Lichtheimia ornata]